VGCQVPGAGLAGWQGCRLNAAALSQHSHEQAACAAGGPTAQHKNKQAKGRSRTVLLTLRPVKDDSDTHFHQGYEPGRGRRPTAAQQPRQETGGQQAGSAGVLMRPGDDCQREQPAAGAGSSGGLRAMASKGRHGYARCGNVGCTSETGQLRPAKVNSLGWFNVWLCKACSGSPTTPDANRI